MFFDSHTHLEQDAIEAIEAKDSRISYVMDIGTDLETSLRAVERAAKYSWCYAVVGYHPHEAKDMGQVELEMIAALARKPKVKAIGEIGLDFHYNYSEPDVQRDCFRKQIRLANDLRMPIVIHSREADQEVMDTLKEEQAFSNTRKSWFNGQAGVLLHCYSGSKEMAEQYVKLGASISVAGPITYKNNRRTVEMVQAIGMEHLMIETDAPYLTPEPHRGKRNQSPYVEFTAMKIAAIKGITLEEVAKITCQNAKTFFGIV
jgi:TatD DNase family protein